MRNMKIRHQITGVEKASFVTSWTVLVAT